MVFSLPQLLEPFTVIEYVPVEAEEETVMVMVEVAELPGLTVTLLGLKLTEAPEGTLLAERLTVCELPDPLNDVTVTVAVIDVLPLSGFSTEPLEGETEIEKSLT